MNCGEREGVPDDSGDLYGAPDSSDAKRRKRQDFTWSQISVLEHVFETNPLPRQALINELSKRLSLTPRTTQVWFQNRRQKWRAMHHAWGQPAPVLKNAANRTTSLEKLLPDLKDKPIPPPPRPPPTSLPTDFTPPPSGVVCVPVGMQDLMPMSSASGQVLPGQIPGVPGQILQPPPQLPADPMQLQPHPHMIPPPSMQQQIMGPPPPCPMPMPMVGQPASGALPQGFQVMPPVAIPGMPPGLIQGVAPGGPQGGDPGGPVLPRPGPSPNLLMPMPHLLDPSLMLPPPLLPSGGGAPLMPSSTPPVPAPLAEALKSVHRPTKRALVAAQRLALAAAAKASISDSDFVAAQPTALEPAALAAAILAEASAGCSAMHVPNEGMDAAAEAAAVIAAAEAAEMAAAQAATTKSMAANSSTPYEIASTSAAETESATAADSGAAEEVGAVDCSAAVTSDMGTIGAPHNERGLAPVHFVGMSGAQPLLVIAPDEQYGLRTVSMPSVGELGCLPNGALALKISQSTSLHYLPHSHLTPFASSPGNMTSSACPATTSDAPPAGIMLEPPSHDPATAAQLGAVAKHDHEMAIEVR